MDADAPAGPLPCMRIWPLPSACPLTLWAPAPTRTGEALELAALLCPLTTAQPEMQLPALGVQHRCGLEQPWAPWVQHGLPSGCWVLRGCCAVGIPSVLLCGLWFQVLSVTRCAPLRTCGVGWGAVEP